MARVNAERMCAQLDGDFVVFFEYDHVIHAVTRNR